MRDPVGRVFQAVAPPAGAKALGHEVAPEAFYSACVVFCFWAGVCGFDPDVGLFGVRGFGELAVASWGSSAHRNISLLHGICPPER